MEPPSPASETPPLPPDPGGVVELPASPLPPVAMPASRAPLGLLVPALAIESEPAAVLRPAAPVPARAIDPLDVEPAGPVDVAAPPDPLLDSGWAFMELSLEQAAAMSANIIVHLRRTCMKPPDPPRIIGGAKYWCQVLVQTC
jgi:hypothetical protein